MNVNSILSRIVPVIAALLMPLAAEANVRIAGLFSPHMVLQRNMPVPVWGWDKSGQVVTVSFGGQMLTTTADAAGRWIVKLPAMSANAHPQTLQVHGSSSIVIRDVLVGEVWLCTGQSNMQYPLNGWTRGGHSSTQIDKANYPLIRILTVPNRLDNRPSNALRAAWNPCNPHSVSNFSAVGYFFGRDLYRKLHVPIGLIASDWGGTRIEPWTPKYAFQQTPSLQIGYRQMLGNYTRAQQAFIPRISAWIKQAHVAIAAHGPIPAPPPEPANPMSNPQFPTHIFNAMINPLIPFAIRGNIWYQGESNVGDPLYYTRLKAMINSWRMLWKQGDFPFGIVQIAPCDYGSPIQREALIWRAEEKAAQNVANTGLVGTMDIGLLHNIHPFDKRDVGYRLSRWALATVYGHKHLIWSGPVYQSMVMDGNQAIIHFRHVDGGLISRNGKSLNWFAIAGKNNKFVPAKAVILGNTVVVQARAVPHPTAVEFGWDDRVGKSNLMNKAGFPAMPFNTTEPVAR